MTDDEYRARLAAIEAEANAALDEARRRFTLRFPARRSARYCGGVAEAIVVLGIANIREQIEAEMRARHEALEEEYYACES